MKSFYRMYITQALMFFRDKSTLAITIALPILLAVFIGLIFSKSSTSSIDISLVDEDSKPATYHMIEKIIHSDTKGGVIFSKLNRDEALSKLKQGDTDLVVVFPQGTAESIITTDELSIPVFFDKNRIESGGIGLQLAHNIISRINLSLAKSKEIYKISENSDIVATQSLVEFYFPNLLVLSFLWLSLFATAIPLVQYKESMILKRIGATPISMVSFLSAIVLWRLTIAMVQSILFVTIGYFVVGVGLPQNLLLFLVAIVIGNLTFIFMGIMIGTISKSTSNAESIVQITNLALMFLSGIFFTSDILPDFINKISYLNPLTYLADLIRFLFLGFRSNLSVAMNIIILSLWAIAFLLVSVKRWRWKSA